MTEQDLRNEFKDITGDNWINSQGEPDIDYVSFLETRLIRNLGVIGDVIICQCKEPVWICKNNNPLKCSDCGGKEG